MAEVKPAAAPAILVVDDDPDFVQITRTILLKEGYGVSTAANGAQAWEAMMKTKPDVVLLDVMMSSTLEGVDLSRKMAAEPRLKNVPIIMISSIDSTFHADKLPDNLHIPIDAWISKPVDPDHLLRTVRRFVPGRPAAVPGAAAAAK
ncbi:MAG TPA: response regulator [Anaerolineae bacterium]|nr:response regulator [Anaerolineae bacterium]